MTCRYATFERQRAALLCALAAVLCGCGGDRAEVTGQLVRASGEPIVGAQVVARAATGESVVGTTDAQGRYRLDALGEEKDVPPGDYEVIILEDRGHGDEMRPATLPPRYGNPSQSGLSFTVGPGENKLYDITIEGQ